MASLRLPAATALLLACALPACESYRRQLEPVEPVDSTPETVALDDEASPSPDETSPLAQPTQVFPGIRIDARLGLVEFDAAVSPLIFEPYEGRTFYLEQFVCKRGTKDHESLVVTDAVPSQIHAALLMVGLESGSPVVWEYPRGRPTPIGPEGPVINVEFLLAQGDESEVALINPRSWVIARRGSKILRGGQWVFAGSAVAGAPETPFYEADAAGTIVGLASFGTEVIAWSKPLSHEETDGQLEWIADLEAIPPAETPLIVRLRAVADE